MVRSPRPEGAGGPDGRSLRQETQSRECKRSLLQVLESCSEHMFQSWGNLLVHFHVIESTWEAPSHLASSHTKGALLENLIFLTTDAGFQSRCLRHVCNVCVWGSGWNANRAKKCWERERKPSFHAGPFEHIWFLLETWLAAVWLPSKAGKGE